ncbi:hypothetical protein PQX77_002913 [Marasmius sp. AFHP31]|nr:hypothetical protein PQX77_002913 [Marasmius sp. AFHP31]
MTTAHSDIAASVDVLIVGAGFSGLTQLVRLRKIKDISIQVLEERPDLGGVWYSNNYPGARTDSEWNIYQLPFEDVYQHYSPKESFPDRNAILDYFRLVDEKLDVKKHIRFNTRVDSAHWDRDLSRWIVTSTTTTAASSALQISAKFLVLCTGISAAPYVPDFKGLHDFKGTMHHTLHWPQEGVDLAGKRVGVVGTGASGVQIIQTIFDQGLESLTAFQRTPNIAIPSRLRQLDELTVGRERYAEVLEKRLQSFTGFEYDLIFSDPAEKTPEEREQLLEELWDKGGLRLWIAGYLSTFTDAAHSREVYDFWRKKQGMRVVDPVLREKLVPTEPPHHFGNRRPSLEQRYYEAFNHPNVRLVDSKETPISEFTETGIKTEDGKEYMFDVIVLATGFDAITGGITRIDIRGREGIAIKDKWEDGLRTQLGLATVNFPNMFFVYGPQAPTAFSNGPSCIDIQSRFITTLIADMTAKAFSVVEPTIAGEIEWTAATHESANRTLVPDASKSWYMGSNIPGKKVETLNYIGGVPTYIDKLRQCEESGWEGWTFE